MQEKDDRSIDELIAELSRETVTLVRQEVQLAKTEMSQKASRAGKSVGFLLVRGVVACTGVRAIVAAVIITLGSAIPLWLSALVVGLVIAAAAESLSHARCCSGSYCRRADAPSSEARCGVES